MGNSDPRASTVAAQTLAGLGWRPPMKKSLNEVDFPLFTHRGCLIGEPVVRCSGPAGGREVTRLLLVAETR
jgi:hypothetical protein